MRTLISLYPETHFILKFPSVFTQIRNRSLFIHNRSSLNVCTTISNFVRVSCSTNSTAICNGWDDLRIRVDSDDEGESNPIKRFLIILGIDDKKYVFTFMLGFFCALAISRVRVSSLIVLPAAAIVFSVGYSFGFVNGRPQKGSLNGTKRRSKDESMRLDPGKIRKLLSLFDGFDVRISELRNDINKAIDYESVELDDLEGYVDTVDCIGGVILNARNVVEDYIDSASLEGHEASKNLMKKQNKKEEIGHNGFNLFESIGSFLRVDAARPKSSTTSIAGRATVPKDVDHRAREHLQGLSVVIGSNSAGTNDNVSHKKRESWRNMSEKNKFGYGDQVGDRIFRQAKIRTGASYVNMETSVSGGWYNYQDIRFMNNEQTSSTNSSYREITENTDFENYRASLGEDRMNAEDELRSKEYQSEQGNEVCSISSSTISEDVIFDKCLTKANDILKEAKECLKARNDGMLAEEMLVDCAKLLSEAIAMKPMSLLAIGQLGNTYLLHGELKLRSSRELRRLLSRNDDFVSQRKTILLDEASPSKDGIANLLVNVCEECETLLVEAGRKYRTALAIDGNDLRALYNWGLALSFRAQLIADIGPEAALDADKLFLAAIDKFNAMMSRSNVYAPEALFRWGVALQQRSQLRPSNSRDKMKLLQQAKRLYEDAIDMGSQNLQVREALSTCISELHFNDF